MSRLARYLTIRECLRAPRRLTGQLHEELRCSLMFGTSPEMRLRRQKPAASFSEKKCERRVRKLMKYLTSRAKQCRRTIGLRNGQHLSHGFSGKGLAPSPHSYRVPNRDKQEAVGACCGSSISTSLFWVWSCHSWTLRRRGTDMLLSTCIHREQTAHKQRKRERERRREKER